MFEIDSCLLKNFTLFVPRYNKMLNTIKSKFKTSSMYIRGKVPKQICIKKQQTLMSNKNILQSIKLNKINYSAHKHKLSNKKHFIQVRSRWSGGLN